MSNLRIVKIGDEQALTLSNYVLENTEFFISRMQTIDSSFMKTELKIEKTEVKVAMAHSVFGKDKYKDENKGIESRTSATTNSRK